MKEIYLYCLLCYRTFAYRKFTAKLIAYYKGFNLISDGKLSIVFISCDEDQATFDKYFKDMPWKALPFSSMLNSPVHFERSHLFRS